MRTRGRTPAQRLVRRPLPREQVDGNSRRRCLPFQPVIYDDLTYFRFPAQYAVTLQSGLVVDGREPHSCDVPVPTGPWSDGSDA